MATARKFSSTGIPVLAALLGTAIAGAAIAQEQAQPAAATPQGAGIEVPDRIEVFGKALPPVVKATALVNGAVITQTDVDQRLAWLALENGSPIAASQLDALRQQILRELVDETLQIQAAKSNEITITDKEIDRAIVRYASDKKLNVQQLDDFLKDSGSSVRTIRRKIEGEIAWQRLQSAKIENTFSVGDEEVQAVLDKLKADKGTQEYRVGEIFLSASSDQMPQVMSRAEQILSRLREGGEFSAYARQYSEASTAAVGGDLGWVRPETLPSEIGARLQVMRPGQISPPIALPGGVSIIGVMDSRRILTADPRAANLTLKQLTVTFPAGTTRAQAEPTIARFAEAARNIGGCGGADRIATQFNASVVEAERVVRDLPPVLQELLLPLQVGQSTQPWGNLEEGVKVLVICGRDEVDPSQPTFEQVLTRLSDERVNLRARRYLRDLRRDAVIEFR